MAFAKFFRRQQRDADAAREIASYIAIETDDNIARGMSPRAAHDAAVRKFGNATRVREEIYWMNTIRPIDTLWQDLRYAIRLLLRDKGFAAAAIVSLAPTPRSSSCSMRCACARCRCISRSSSSKCASNRASRAAAASPAAGRC